MTYWWQSKNLNPDLTHGCYFPLAIKGCHEPPAPGNSEHLQGKSRNESDKPTGFSHNRFIC